MTVIKLMEDRKVGLYKVPSNMMEGILALHRFILRCMQCKCPEGRASAMHYFQQVYQGEPIDSKDIAYLSIACLHLGLKIQMQPHSIRSFVHHLDNARQDPDLLRNLPCLANLPQGPNFEHETFTTITKLEMNLIAGLDFHLETVLPYQYTDHFIRRILQWHISDSDTKYHLLCSDLNETAGIFLNDMQQTAKFYTSPVNVMAMIATRLAFEMHQLPLIHPSNVNIFTILVPSITSDEFEALATEQKQLFIDRGVKFSRPLKSLPNFDHKLMENWLIVPIQPPPGFGIGFSPPPPPPSFKLIQNFTGPKDSYNHLWNQHQPPMPPPPEEGEIADKSRPISPPTPPPRVQTPVENQQTPSTPKYVDLRKSDSVPVRIRERDDYLDDDRYSHNNRYTRFDDRYEYRFNDRRTPTRIVDGRDRERSPAYHDYRDEPRSYEHRYNDPPPQQKRERPKISDFRKSTSRDVVDTDRVSPQPPTKPDDSSPQYQNQQPKKKKGKRRNNDTNQGPADYHGKTMTLCFEIDE